ncbi:hypothetical protein BGX38DRAFT_1141179 [Terfezia claveryi]|nr:hypothetical protein BGX38DRAFT_1141179 [Terfezia claveryi]
MLPYSDCLPHVHRPHDRDHDHGHDAPRPSTLPSPQAQQQPSAAPGTSNLPLLRCGPLLRYCGTDYPDEHGESGLPMWRGSVLLVVAGASAGLEGVRHKVPEVLFTGEVVSGDRYGGWGGGIGSSRMREELDEGIGFAIGGEGEVEVAGEYSLLSTPPLHATHPPLLNVRSAEYSEGQIYTDEEGHRRRLVRAKPKLILEEENVFCYRYDICVALESVERRVTYIVCGVERVVYADDNEEKQEEKEKEEEGEKKEEEEGKSNQDTSNEKPTPSLPTSINPLLTSFHLPTSHSTMRLIFHSCNGFSLNPPITTFTGPVLFRSLLAALTSPTTSPHLLLGGGDQIYSDAIRTSGPLSHWANLTNPSKRRKYPYSPGLAQQVNSWYRENYISWYATRPFSDVNGRIPMMNMWDDHDIIDGWGSYTDHFMQCPVFLGVGSAAWRYYMVFQHHTPPRVRVRVRMRVGCCRRIKEGRSIALLALDARTERTRHVICPPETYDAIFARLERELTRAGAGGEQPIKHILILLGVPIAYPRLVWLEMILRSPVMGVLNFLNKRFGVAGKLFNHFDGAADILDDLDDHWTARVHKKERAALITRWQALSRTYSVRVSILSGDVHLAAVGRFYTRVPKGLGLGEKEEGEVGWLRRDWRYTPNIISSAITNMPPPGPVAALLARRNKVHRFDGECRETLCGVFGEDIDGRVRTGRERLLMRRRNYCVIMTVGERRGMENGGEVGGLWVELRVESKTGDWGGGTKGYGFMVPSLVMREERGEERERGG